MLRIRTEQLEAFQPVAEASFESRVIDYLHAEHEDALIRSSSRTLPIAQLADEDLIQMVRRRIKKAREYGIRWESSLTAFVVLTFIVGANFDEQPAIRQVLTDEQVEPDLRIDQLWERTTEQDWEE